MTAHALTRQVRTGGQTDGSRTHIANRGSSHIECITAIHPNSDAARELIERYGTIQDALAAYNYGEQGAKQHLWKNGIYVYEYNQTIMSRMKEIEEELEQDAGD